MILRNMHAEELPQVFDWAAAEGWNPGLDDAAAFEAADPEGFFVAEIDGVPVAAISVVNHSESFAFLGLYICRPAHRGQGVGLALWTHALEHAGGRTVGLDGVPAQQANYRRSGFVHAGKTQRFSGRIDGAEDPAVGPVSRQVLDRLIDMEAAANGYRKARFLRAWLTDSDTRRTLVCRAGGNPEGFATIRLCRDGAKIGPLVATDQAMAVSLIRAAAKQFDAGTFILDVPGTNTGLTDFCCAEGMVSAFDTARMYRGPAPVAGPAVRTVATLELG